MEGLCLGGPAGSGGGFPFLYLFLKRLLHGLLQERVKVGGEVLAVRRLGDGSSARTGAHLVGVGPFQEGSTLPALLVVVNGEQAFESVREFLFAQNAESN